MSNRPARYPACNGRASGVPAKSILIDRATDHAIKHSYRRKSRVNSAFRTFAYLIGFTDNRASHQEKIISGLGGFVGILLILTITRLFVAETDAAWIVASMGASAVLLFAVPHGPLSQPWPLTGGHLVSALVGVLCYRLIPDLSLASAAAVGLAILAMYALRCIHPPGGATALAAVVGGADVHSLGYTYLVTPVLINALTILCVAIAFNYLFSWRRYPVALMRYPRQATDSQAPSEDRSYRQGLESGSWAGAHPDRVGPRSQTGNDAPLPKALDDVLRIDQIAPGRCYSNGEYGDDWSVRQIVDESPGARPEEDQVLYQVVAGKGRRRRGVTTRHEFAHWAKYEVFLNENSWQRVASPTTRANAA